MKTTGYQSPASPADKLKLFGAKTLHASAVKKSWVSKPKKLF